MPTQPVHEDPLRTEHAHPEPLLAGRGYWHLPAHLSHRPRRRSPVLLILVLVTALLGLVLTLLAVRPAPAPVRVHGTLEVAASALNGTNPSDYTDISNGGQVVVIDSTGTAHVIGTGILVKGKTLTLGLINADFYSFQLTVPAGLPRYGIQIGNNRGTIWFSLAQMRAGPSLCLGDGC